MNGGEIGCSFVPVRTGFDLPTESACPTVDKLLRHRMGRAPGPGSTVLWSAEFFGLHRSCIFQVAAEEDQVAILMEASRRIFEEAYFIERAGVAFAAKMLLLAESMPERSLYAVFAAEEARHLHGVSAVASRWGQAPTPGPFHALLERILEQGDRASLQFLVQVLLEGWGLDHYRRLAGHCRDGEVASLLHGILRDEAGHHGSGLALSRPEALTASARAFVFDICREFLGQVQVGPVGLLQAVESVLGPLGRAQRMRLLHELDGPGHAHQRLARLADLMRFARAEALVERLQVAGAFTPVSPEAIA